MSAWGAATAMSRAGRHDAAQDAVLVERARRNESEAFARIIDAYQGRVLGFVSRMLPSDEDALDVTQEVFIRAYRNLDRFDSRSSLRTWLFKIAHNLCIDSARRRKRSFVLHSTAAGRPDESEWEFDDPSAGPEDLVLSDELRQVVSQAISEMSEKLREVLLLHEEQEMAYEEIAQTLGIPVGTVKSRLFLARGHLQKAVARYQNQADHLEGGRR